MIGHQLGSSEMMVILKGLMSVSGELGRRMTVAFDLDNAR